MSGLPDRNCVPVRKGRRVWPSQKAAAKDLGVTPSAISRALRMHGHLENIGRGPGRRGNSNAPSRPVAIGPLQFRSVKRAAEELRIARITLRRLLAGEASENIREKVMAAAMDYMHRKGAANVRPARD